MMMEIIQHKHLQKLLNNEIISSKLLLPLDIDIDFLYYITD